MVGHRTMEIGSCDKGYLKETTSDSSYISATVAHKATGIGWCESAQPGLSRVLLPVWLCSSDSSFVKFLLTLTTTQLYCQERFNILVNNEYGIGRRVSNLGLAFITTVWRRGWYMRPQSTLDTSKVVLWYKLGKIRPLMSIWLHCLPVLSFMMV